MNRAKFAWIARTDCGLIERGVVLAASIEGAEAQVMRMMTHAAQRGDPWSAFEVGEGPEPLDPPRDVRPPDEATD